ncbi:MAG: hypothetical protein LKI60_05025 [Bifidobacterium tibiigranuli]|nr:hypothetical protein [Bifidobacterium tibiigranuli]MCI1797590.1 hypothetical protein [Bifidobacterium tibiigranuli]
MISRLVLTLVAEGELLYFGIHEGVEGFARLTFDNVVLLHVQLFEEGLIGDAAQRVVEAYIQLVTVAGQCQTVIQMGFGLVVLHVPGLDLHVEECEPPADTLLFGPEQVDGNRSRVVGLQELATFGEQVGSFGPVGVPFPACDVVQLVELGHDQPTQGADGVFGYLDSTVVILNGGFHVGHVHGVPFTVGAFGVPAGTQEIRVDDTLAAARVRQDEPGTALPAVDAALQIVVVGLGFLSGRLVRVEHGLDAIPDFFGHQRFVQAVVGRAPERDLSLVVGVGQEAVHG